MAPSVNLRRCDECACDAIDTDRGQEGIGPIE